MKPELEKITDKNMPFVYQISDYLLKYPEKTFQEVSEVFQGKLNLKSKRTQQYINAAREYNAQIFENAEKKKIKAIEKKVAKTTVNGLNRRERLTAILEDIAIGKTEDVNGEILIPSFAERVSAIKTIGKWEGYEIVVKQEPTTTNQTLIIVSNENAKNEVEKFLNKE